MSCVAMTVASRSRKIKCDTISITRYIGIWLHNARATLAKNPMYRVSQEILLSEKPRVFQTL